MDLQYPSQKNFRKPLAPLAILSKIRILAQNLPPAAEIRPPSSTHDTPSLGGEGSDGALENGNLQ